ncbi:MAG: S41 family peptidase [Clostridiaceae bacterium]|nr:S41 family peptidase [Clostridiaceae bacterium]
MKRRFLSLLLSTMLVLGLTLTSTAYSYNLDETEIIKHYILNSYVETLTEEDLQGETPQEIIKDLDLHTEYYPSEEFQTMMENLSGQFYGIGVQIRDINGNTFITEVIEGGPAHGVKLRMGDIIAEVDGIDIREKTVDQAVGLIRGAKNTAVIIGIERYGHEELLKFPIKRGPITLRPVEHKVIEEVGYIKIKSFDNQMMESVIKALDEFEEKNIDNMIIDLRDNPGGSLNEVIKLSRLFIPRGPIVHIESRDNKVTYTSSLQEPSVENLVVLVNENSASASEIFAAAVQDTGVGNVIGKQTVGKGSVQRIYTLPTGAGFKMTEARYLSPNENKIDGIGVKPDIEIERFGEDISSMNLLPIHITRRATMGEYGQDIRAAQQRLQLMGYTIEDEEGIYGESTFEAVKQFQADNPKLYAYGVLDYTTQTTLETAFVEWVNGKEQDLQLQLGIDILTK